MLLAHATEEGPMADKHANPVSGKPADENADEDIVGSGEHDNDFEDDDAEDDLKDDDDLEGEE